MPSVNDANTLTNQTSFGFNVEQWVILNMEFASRFAAAHPPGVDRAIFALNARAASLKK